MNSAGVSITQSRQGGGDFSLQERSRGCWCYRAITEFHISLSKIPSCHPHGSTQILCPESSPTGQAKQPPTPQGSLCTQNAAQTTWEFEILPPPLLPPAEPIEILPIKCRKPRCTADPAGCSHPRNCEYCTGESCWDEQAAEARCIEQPANSSRNTLQIFATLPLPLNQLELQESMKQETIKCSYTN